MQIDRYSAFGNAACRACGKATSTLSRQNRHEDARLTSRRPFSQDYTLITDVLNVLQRTQCNSSAVQHDPSRSTNITSSSTVLATEHMKVLPRPKPQISICIHLLVLVTSCIQAVAARDKVYPGNDQPSGPSGNGTTADQPHGLNGNTSVMQMLPNLTTGNVSIAS